MKALADNLYFKNLDNNVGVFHRLIDAAEEEECKEALLAYFYLLKHGGRNAQDIDIGIEQWLREKTDFAFDFEVSDALDKLRRLGLIECVAGVDAGAEIYTAIASEDAKIKLDRIWDGFFGAQDKEAT
jgi:hypothetical protein